MIFTFIYFQDFEGEVLRTDSQAECASWKQQLEAATHKHCVPTDENDNTDQMNGKFDKSSSRIILECYKLWFIHRLRILECHNP